MRPRRKIPEIFISYAHSDRKHFEKLRSHLSGLAREGRAKFWWDGELVIGKAWENQIMRALQRADMVVLLLSANFFESEYCIETELKAAQIREKEGRIDLVPIWVSPFDWESHWLGNLQAITINGKSIIESRLGETAWKKVAEQLRLKIELAEGKRPVMQIFNEIEEVVQSGFPSLPRAEPASLIHSECLSVSEFWKAKSTWLPEIGFVSVRGTLSQFAPMVMGPPKAKRLLHREFRRAIEANRRFGERKRITINACMSISAGQMVYVGARKNKPKRLLGLYESIVRNSIPVFVLSDYYVQKLLPLFKKSGTSSCLEAIVTGRIFLLNNNFIRRFLARQGLNKILPSYLIDDLCRDAFALEVGGEGTRVEVLPGKARYLDGDIWVAVKANGTERFVTSFVDITKAEEREEESHRLLQETQGNQVLAWYDRLGSIEELLEKQGPFGFHNDK